MRTNIVVAMMAVAWGALSTTQAGCHITRDRTTVGRNGEMHTLIHCQTNRPDKCTARAQEVCGQYTIIEPVQPSPEYKGESRMVVHCTPPGAPAGSAQP
jgi:hypothetical protein